MLRLPFGKALRPQIPAKQTAETRLKFTGICLAQVFDLFWGATASMPPYPQKHEPAFHQPALGPKSARAVHAGCRRKDLLMDLPVCNRPEHAEHGHRSIDVIAPVGIADYAPHRIIHGSPPAKG